MSPDAPQSTDAPVPALVAAPAPAAGSYTAGEVTERIRLYMVIAALSSLIGQAADLGSMQDAALAAISPLRWGIKLVLIVAGVVLAAVNARRAAIDRSTSSPGTAAPPLPVS